MAEFFSHYWVDITFIGILLVFIFTSRGFLSTFLEMFSFLCSLLFAYGFYSFFGDLLTTYLSIPRGIADAGGFFIAWIVMESMLYVVIFFVSHRYLHEMHADPINRKFGFVAAIFQGSLIFLFIISFVFALPVKGSIKNAILESYTGPFFVNISQSLQLKTKGVFGGAVSEAMNFLTIKPESSETVQFDFKLEDGEMQSDGAAENEMFSLINEERAQRGLEQLEFDTELRDVARLYGTEMFSEGFFSHISQIDGDSPADRATEFGIQYMILGENLAFAPDVYLAHQGLMNSEGHRANILGTEFGSVGVGVIDGGVYGKIFVQEFSD